MYLTLLGVDKGIFYSYPVVYQNKQHTIINGLPISEFAAQRMKVTLDELKQERDGVRKFLPN